MKPFRYLPPSSDLEMDQYSALFETPAYLSPRNGEFLQRLKLLLGQKSSGILVDAEISQVLQEARTEVQEKNIDEKTIAQFYLNKRVKLKHAKIFGKVYRVGKNGLSGRPCVWIEFERGGKSKPTSISHIELALKEDED